MKTFLDKVKLSLQMYIHKLRQEIFLFDFSLIFPPEKPLK